MDSDHPSPLGDNENPHGESRGLVGSPQFPIPSPSPSLSKDTTTTADVHTKVFGTLMMNGLMQEYVMDLKNKGFTDFFIQELMLETGESGTKPSVRLMKTIGDRWVAEGIYTRLEAKQRKDASKNKRSTNGSSTTGKTGQAAYKKSYEEMSDKFARLRESEDENGIA
jgi:hypothetical protein